MGIPRESGRDEGCRFGVRIARGPIQPDVMRSGDQWKSPRFRILSSRDYEVSGIQLLRGFHLFTPSSYGMNAWLIFVFVGSPWLSTTSRFLPND